MLDVEEGDALVALVLEGAHPREERGQVRLQLGELLLEIREQAQQLGRVLGHELARLVRGQARHVARDPLGGLRGRRRGRDQRRQRVLAGLALLLLLPRGRGRVGGVERVQAKVGRVQVLEPLPLHALRLVLLRAQP